MGSDKIELKKPEDIDFSALLEEFSGLFKSNISDMLGVQLEIEYTEEVIYNKFMPTEGMISQIDFHGFLVGFFAISCSERSVASMLGHDVPEGTAMPELIRKLVVDATNEILNTISGKLLNFLIEDFPILTMRSPRMLFGYPIYSSTTCHELLLQTDHGDFRFTVSIDTMADDMMMKFRQKILEDLQTNS